MESNEGAPVPIEPAPPTRTRDGHALCKATTKGGKPCPTWSQIEGWCYPHWHMRQSDEHKHSYSSRGGIASKHHRRLLRTPEQILSYVEQIAEEVTIETADLARVRIWCCQVALRCVADIAEKKAAKKEGRDFSFGRQTG